MSPVIDVGSIMVKSRWSAKSLSQPWRYGLP